ncbi:MAG TPA: molybdenum ABC transporter ATP-binding protein [Candidatus Acidoferrum sp.]
MLQVAIRKQFRAAGAPAFDLQVAQEFAPGITILFGPSGAGKSTLLDCIAGLQRPDTGRITLGKEIFFDADHKISLPPQRRRIAYVFQSLALFPHLSVEENVAYGLSSNASCRRDSRVARILEAFHITSLRRRKPAELSGGEKQRVALARSLVTEPRVLLLDEPLTGLDSPLRRAILQDLRAWNDANRIPILYVTHNREELDAIGERVVALLQGRVVESGAPRDVLDAPRSLGLARAAGFENLMPARVLEMRDEDGVMRVALTPSNCELEIPLGPHEPGEQLQVAIRAGDILLATQPPEFLSARNVLAGTLESLESRGTLVIAQVNAGAHFIVHLTPGAVRSLQLSAGRAVWLVIKTHSCHLVSS